MKNSDISPLAYFRIQCSFRVSSVFLDLALRQNLSYSYTNLIHLRIYLRSGNSYFVCANFRKFIKP